MRSKSSSQGSHSSQTKSTEKDAKSTKAGHKKLLSKRAPIKLRASTGKCVANRTRDKSPKVLSSPSHRSTSTPTEKVRSGSRTPASVKSGNMTQKMSRDDRTSVCKKRSVRAAQTQSQKHGKGRNKKKTSRQTDADNFLDLWAFASIGKREASLNASMKVNILYEKQSPSKSPRTSPKKSEAAAQGSKQDENTSSSSDRRAAVTEATNNIRVEKKNSSSDSMKEIISVTDCDSSLERNTSPEKNDKKKTVLQSQPLHSSCKKRKSPGYKIFKEEPVTKIRKIEKKSQGKAKNRIVRSRKVMPPGHQLCNIIEKCPRQASLVAKAMIAMGQEEETVPGLAARTTVYDWMELRSLNQCQARRIRWFHGYGNISKGKQLRLADGQPSAKDDDTYAGSVELESQSDDQVAVEESESLHSTLLRTLHQIGDSRLLKEYLRAQKEDFPGHIDVESCSSPEKHQEPLPPAEELKKPITAPPVAASDKPEKDVEKIDKSVACSPVKPQPCRVATPVPQFPMSPRNNHMSNSFIHHPVAQPLYPQPSAHPQPIKVTPYPPSPTYIYQYAMDRSQAGLYAAPSPAPVSYGVSSGQVTHRDYTSTFTLNHMGSLSLGRRGVNPYPPGPYSTPLHVPMQQLGQYVCPGFNYSAYYPSPLQALSQQNMPAMQAVPIHQQYPLVQAPVLTQHQIPPDMSQLESYQHEYSPYSPLSSMGPDPSCLPPPSLPPPPPPPAHRSSCMPPSCLPPPPPAHRPTPMAPPALPLRQPALSHHSVPPVSPMESLRSMNPAGSQPISRSPALNFQSSYIHHQGNPHEQLAVLPSCRPAHQQQQQQYHQLARDHTSRSSLRYSVTLNGLSKSFSPCKKEHDDSSSSYDCDLISKNSMCNNECLPRSLGSSRTDSEGSDISDLLHSAHTTMYPIDGLHSMDSIREFHQTQGSAIDSTLGNCSPSKMNVFGHTSLNTSYSVSSILDMPACKVKSEPEPKVCNASHLSNVFSTFEPKIVEQSQSAFICFAAAAGSSSGSDPKEAKDTAPNNLHKQQSEVLGESSNIGSHQSVKVEEKSDLQKSTSIIVIDDTDVSSDDEPLARLVKAKSSDDTSCLPSETAFPDGQMKVSIISKPKVPSSHIPTPQLKVTTKHKDKVKDKVTEQMKPADGKKDKKPVSMKSLATTASSKCVIVKAQPDISSSENHGKPSSSVPDEESKSVTDKETRNKAVSRKTTLASSSKHKKPAKKIKALPVWPQTPTKVNTNHGWSWIGEAEMKPIPKVTPGREESIRIRKCYKSMKHTSGEIVSVRDCVILQSDGDGSIPFVAKVSALWENVNGEMMFSMLWYYQPEHTAAGREPDDGDQELFASKHREENSVACIDDKCFVLMYNEYCRLEAEVARHEQGVSLPRWRQLMPDITDSDKQHCRPLPPSSTCADNIWFCRYDYDIRKKIVKKPKHKKSNLRYRAPYKPV